jgi:hypothetical protein
MNKVFCEDSFFTLNSYMDISLNISINGSLLDKDNTIWNTNTSCKIIYQFRYRFHLDSCRCQRTNSWVTTTFARPSRLASHIWTSSTSATPTSTEAVSQILDPPVSFFKLSEIIIFHFYLICRKIFYFGCLNNMKTNVITIPDV